MKGGKNEMVTIFKKDLSIDAKNKGGYSKKNEIIKVSVMTQIRLDLAKQTSWKSLGCAPSMREACKRCKESGTQISESKIGD